MESLESDSEWKISLNINGDDECQVKSLQPHHIFASACRANVGIAQHTFLGCWDSSHQQADNTRIWWMQKMISNQRFPPWTSPNSCSWWSLVLIYSILRPILLPNSFGQLPYNYQSKVPGGEYKPAISVLLSPSSNTLNLLLYKSAALPYFFLSWFLCTLRIGSFYLKTLPHFIGSFTF